MCVCVVCLQRVSSAVRDLDFIIFLSAPKTWHASPEQGSEWGGRSRHVQQSSCSRARASDPKWNRKEKLVLVCVLHETVLFSTTEPS